MSDAWPSKADLRAAKTTARRDLGTRAGVNGVGIGDGVLRVYVRDVETRDALPTEVDGVPVEAVLVGDVTAQ